MAIQAIDEAGNIEWQCPHVPGEADSPCGVRQVHHISHEAIGWHGHPETKPEHRTVSLPPCSACGAQTFLKVHFTEKELKAPNMWLPWNSFLEEQFQLLQQAYAQLAEESDHKNMIAQQIQQIQQAKANGGQHTPSHAMAQRHMELARQLIAMGKVPSGQQGGSEA